MRSKTPQKGQHSELYIAHESLTELTLQSRVPKAQAIKLAWEIPLMVGGFFTLFFGIAALIILGPLVSQGAIQSQLAWTIALLICVAPSALIWAALLSSTGYQVFTFDHSQQQVISTMTNLLGRTRTQRIPFGDIQDIELTENDSHERDSSFISIYLVLKNRKKLLLSHSPSIRDQIEWTTTLKNHRTISEKVRVCLGLSNYVTSGERAQDVRIPTEAELQQANEEALASLRQMADLLFSDKLSKEKHTEKLREQVAHSPHDPTAWEELAMALALQHNTRSEVQDAYRRAEMLYREQGKQDQAAHIASLLNRFSS